MLNIILIGVGWGWGGVAWVGMARGEVGGMWEVCGLGWGGVSYQCLKRMVLRLSGELPTLNMNGIKGLW